MVINVEQPLYRRLLDNYFNRKKEDNNINNGGSVW